MIVRLFQFLQRIWRISHNRIYYIGGADVLPPPLKGKEEEAALVALESGEEKAKSSWFGLREAKEPSQKPGMSLARPALVPGKDAGVSALNPGAGRVERLGPWGRLLGLWLCMVERGNPVSLSQGLLSTHGHR